MDIVVVVVITIVILVVIAVVFFFVKRKWVPYNKVSSEAKPPQQILYQLQQPNQQIADPIASAPEQDEIHQPPLQVEPGNYTKAEEFLGKWNLLVYYDAFIETGWEDISMWRELVKQEDQLNNIFELKSGHKFKFVKYVTEELNDDLHVVANEGEGAVTLQ